METLIKSFDSFSSRKGNTSFFVAHDRAGDVLEQGVSELKGPVFLTSQLEHAQNFLPHAEVLECLLRPDAKVVDFRHHPKSENGTWDLTHDEDSEDQATNPLLKKSDLVGDGLIDGVFHEFNDILELHNVAVLTPVCVHPAAHAYNDVDALPTADSNDEEAGPDTGVEEDMRAVTLPKAWTEFLASQPETGSGYHIADVTLKDGTVVENAAIYGCEFMLVPKEQMAEVAAMRCKSKKDLGF